MSINVNHWNLIYGGGAVKWGVFGEGGSSPIPPTGSAKRRIPSWDVAESRSGVFVWQSRGESGVAPVTTTERNAGGWPEDGGTEYARRSPRPRTEDEIREERERLGILPRRIIEDVAARQAADYRLDDQQRVEELRGELLLRNIEIKSAHIQALNDIREKIILDELSMRLRRQMDDRDILALLVLAASV